MRDSIGPTAGRLSLTVAVRGARKSAAKRIATADLKQQKKQQQKRRKNASETVFHRSMCLAREDPCPYRLEWRKKKRKEPTRETKRRLSSNPRKIKERYPCRSADQRISLLSVEGLSARRFLSWLNVALSAHVGRGSFKKIFISLCPS